MLLFLDIGGGEMLLIILVGLLIFGGDKLPEIIRSVSRGASYIKKASNEVKEQINRETGISDTINNLKKDVADTVSEASKDFDPTWETVVPSPA
ncbi:MAG: twin-arginine translocase TatA/TatE family subunit, partial [Flavobacteriales bacterium]|nr:twin-arginine translocase TatA/TatE family subunit [Flavobacteriales bacterium]